ncbi:SGNH/GDSL hydrolase family protein [Listeria fleischmannii]|uniref:SGNH/GDSL hydrolase family protein n=1 Tax=Listeria fleischmannii TaxID=1069827 RepID=UPI001625DF5D|nr:SGNH/GDSL hydrolase family protein [Listeria fleischmannii]MBC1420079.1 SGNH/GDSL hydrolase family protein [Listeria fleischmannii]
MEKLNRQGNGIQGSDWAKRQNENWDRIEKAIGVDGILSPAEVVSKNFPVSPENLEGAIVSNYFNPATITKDTSIANLTGKLVAAVGANVSNYIRVTGASVLGCNYAFNTAGCFYDANFVYVGYARFVASASANWYTCPVPERAVYFRAVVTTTTLNKYMLTLSADKQIYTEHRVSLPFIKRPSSLNGLKLITFGDSITWQDGQTINGVLFQGYQTYLREAGAEVTNEGVGNMSFAKNTKVGAEELYLYKKIVMDEYDLTGVDAVTIACGTNDVGFNVPLGEAGGFPDSTWDTTTSLGALRGILEYIRSNFPTVDIYLMTPLQNKTRDMVKHEYISDGIIKLGGIYSAPVLDLFRESGLSKYTFDLYTRDGLHPNNDGYAKYSALIVRFLETEMSVRDDVTPVKMQLDTHLSDTTRHILASERTTWNAKETPQGALDKANAAESNAKGYTDSFYERKNILTSTGVYLNDAQSYTFDFSKMKKRLLLEVVRYVPGTGSMTYGKWEIGLSKAFIENNLNTACWIPMPGTSGEKKAVKFTISGTTATITGYLSNSQVPDNGFAITKIDIE